MDVKNQIFAYKQLMASSVMTFTKLMFNHIHKSDYVVGDHHLLICKALDDVVKGKTKKLIINIAPRYGKTELCSRMFIAYGMAINPQSKFLHLSYSATLTEENSVAVKDIIKSPFYQLIFPETVVRKNSDTKAYWFTTDGGGLYATSTLGQITGFGAGQVEGVNKDIPDFQKVYNPANFAGAIVIDDPMKPEDAFSENMREAVNRRFETTIRSRVNSRDTPIIITMQRLHEHDLCGYLQQIEPDEWKILSIPCISYDEMGKEKPLWEFKHTLKDLYKIKEANSYVFETQYQQHPMPLEGLLYERGFRTYSELPTVNGAKVKNYTDTADTGGDYLCSIDYLETNIGNYVIDVLYTQLPMDKTEPLMAKQLTKDGVDVCVIESNNGGRIFGRNVERETRLLGNTKTAFKYITQTQNKTVRLFSMSNEVQNLVYMPSDWERRFPKFSHDILTFLKIGNNKNDDAPDALTGTVEMRKNGKLNKKSIYDKVF